MLASNFKVWFTPLLELSLKQHEQVKQHFTQETQRPEVVKILEKSTVPYCPTCKQTSVYSWGYHAALQRYRCRNCNHTFTALSEHL